MLFLINIYSDSLQSALKYLKNTEVDIHNILVMTGDLSGVVHTGVEVRRMDSEMSGLVEQPWLQLMCCAVCLPRGRNFR